MYPYHFEELRNALRSILQDSLSPEAFTWVSTEADAIAQGSAISKLNIDFVMTPRKTGKDPVKCSADLHKAIDDLLPGFTVRGWTNDRLSRVYFLMNLSAVHEEQYLHALDNLFLNAEMNELVALYSALPIYAYPSRWKHRCSEGIRSNIGKVLESIMCNNPYPSGQLDDLSWNQLVLKAIFNDKPLLEIQGLRERANHTLAESISAFAHERWAAHRHVNPVAWILVVDFVDAQILEDLKRLSYSTETADRMAVALVCAECSFEPAKEFLQSRADLSMMVTEGLTWEAIDQQMRSVVR